MIRIEELAKEVGNSHFAIKFEMTLGGVTIDSIASLEMYSKLPLNK